MFLVKDVDFATFTVSKTGVPKVKDHVYYRCYFEIERGSRCISVPHYIDVTKTEYVIQSDNNSLSEYDENGYVILAIYSSKLCCFPYVRA